MLSFVDCSIQVLYDQEKNHNELLMLVNATVSHELRNPLNSLIAQNIEKAALYTQLDKIIQDIEISITPEIYSELHHISTDLLRGLSTQESSANLMVFLV
jgi:signal transduction histidine kinase